MTAKHTVTINVFDGEEYDGDWPTPGYPTLLTDAIAWFQAKMALIPVEYQATARCEIDSTGGYEGSHYGHIEISYERPETSQEAAERQARERAHTESVKAREIATLRSLQAKYGSA